MKKAVFTIEDGRMIYAESSNKEVSWKNMYEQTEWQLESQGVEDQQVTVTIIEDEE